MPNINITDIKVVDNQEGKIRLYLSTPGYPVETAVLIRQLDKILAILKTTESDNVTSLETECLYED